MFEPLGLEGSPPLYQLLGPHPPIQSSGCAQMVQNRLLWRLRFSGLLGKMGVVAGGASFFPKGLHMLNLKRRDPQNGGYPLDFPLKQPRKASPKQRAHPNGHILGGFSGSDRLDLEKGESFAHLGGGVGQMVGRKAGVPGSEGLEPTNVLSGNKRESSGFRERFYLCKTWGAETLTVALCRASCILFILEDLGPG